MPNYDELHRARIRAYSKQIEAAYNRVTDQFARMAANPSAKYASSYTFKNTYIGKDGSILPNKKLSTLADQYTTQFGKELEQIITKGIDAEWSLSNDKNNALVREHITNARALGMDPSLAEGFSLDVLKAFAGRQIEGLGLSSSVWDIAQQFKAELEAHLALGITNGDSAQVISRRVRQYLDKPDQLFRRVRNKNGDLIPSKRMKDYHPGQGVYRSSYKNAMRLARTETNTAYLTADYERWQGIDFVVGIKISLSGSHPCNDICDRLKGNYPKDFKFTGWHPQCLCTATPIMLDDDEFEEYEDALLAGEKYDVAKSKHYVNNIPTGLKDWVRENKKRIQGWKSTPYFLKDNFTLKGGKYVSNRGGKVMPVVPTKVAPKPKATPKPKPKATPTPIIPPIPLAKAATRSRKQIIKDTKKKFTDLENTKEFKDVAKWKAEREFALAESNRLVTEANQVIREINSSKSLSNISLELLESKTKLIGDFKVMQKRYKKAKLNHLRAEEALAPKIADVMSVTKKPDLYFSQRAYGGRQELAIPSRVTQGSEVFARIMGGPKNETWSKIEVIFQNKRKRAYSRNSGAYVFQGDGPATICHEMGHAAEFNSATIKKATRDLMKKRCAGEKLKYYNGKEVCWYDEWMTPYTGRSYYGGKWNSLPEGTIFDIKYLPDDMGTEVFSMWWTELMSDPINFMRKDLEFFEWGYDLILKLQGV